jgi:hypothetical protein
MTRAVVPNVELPASSLVVDKGVLLAVVVAAVAVAVADSATAKHARCTTLPVPIVAMKHRYLFSREKTGLSIAMTATNRNVPIAQTTDDHAGNPHERDWAVLPAKPSQFSPSR